MKRIAGIALAVLLSACSTQNQQIDGPKVFAIQTDATPAGAALSPDIDDLVAETSKSYVTLIVHKDQRANRQDRDTLPVAVTSGSGFVVEGDGYIVTAGHVAIAPGYTVDARGYDGRMYQGKVLALRKDNDTAVIRLNKFSGLPVTPAPDPCLRPGEAVFSLGKPHARGDTARIGEVDAMSFGRPVTYDGFGYPDAMVLRMNTKRGESGGPVFNAQGQLTGMMVSTLSDGTGRSLNLAHAIPSPDLARFICTQTTCSTAWKALSKKQIKSCRA